MSRAGLSAGSGLTRVSHPRGRPALTAAAWSRLGLVAGAAVLLELGCRNGWISRTTLVPPSQAATRLWVLLRAGTAGPAALTTLRNAGLALLLALGAGLPAGLALHALPRLRRALDPLLASYYAVPFFAFYPVLVALLGMNSLPIIAVGFLFAVLAIVLNTLNGLDRIPPVLLKVARLHHMGRLSTALFVQLPSAAPYVFTGLKLAVAYALIGVIASEFILSDQGLGYAIAYAYNDLDMPTMYAFMLLLIVVVTSINLALHACERRFSLRRGGQ